MRVKISILLFTVMVFSISTLKAQEIAIEYLSAKFQYEEQAYSKTILKNEIKGIKVDHIAITGDLPKIEQSEDGFKYIYLFIKGKGNVVANNKDYEIVPETILLPNSIKTLSINTIKNDTLNFLKISSKLTAQDVIDLKGFPKENTQNIYYKKFTDCESYTEPIKSSNTVSRTILPNKYIPRIAMGTVKTKGPDKVGAHEHPMLEQLFLGLSENDIVVYADEAKVAFPQFSLLHIPFGASHSATVDDKKIMYYVWMDFFLDKKGEEWLKTHNTMKKQ